MRLAQINKSLGYANLMTGLNTVFKPDEYEINIFDVFENDKYDNFSFYITFYKKYHIILTISDTGPIDMRQSGPGGSLIIEIESPNPWHQKGMDGREYGWLSYQVNVNEDTADLLGSFSYGSRLDNIIASLEILKTYLLNESSEHKSKRSAFVGNKLSIFSKEIEFQEDIGSTIEDENQIYVLLTFPGGVTEYNYYESHNIFAYSFEGELIWQVSDKPDENSRSYVHIRDADNDSLFAIDLSRKRYIINKSTGDVADFEDKA
jgi:hypothetical protein